MRWLVGWHCTWVTGGYLVHIAIKFSPIAFAIWRGFSRFRNGKFTRLCLGSVNAVMHLSSPLNFPFHLLMYFSISFRLTFAVRTCHIFAFDICPFSFLIQITARSSFYVHVCVLFMSSFRAIEAKIFNNRQLYHS